MIVFSDAWWIGSKEENPEELQLNFPEDMNTGQQTEYDFKGGAGSTSERATDAHEPEHEFSDGENDPKDLIHTTATRHSSRTSGKSLKVAGSSSAVDAFDLDVDPKSDDGEENEIGASTIGGGKDATETEVSEQLTGISKSTTKLKEGSRSNQSSLVQATISTLFKKKEEKMAINTSVPPTSSKGSRKRLHEPGSEEKDDQSKVSGAKQKGKALEERKIATRSTPRKKQRKVSDDEIEDISNPSQVSDDEIEDISDPSQDSSDEEWGA